VKKFILSLAFWGAVFCLYAQGSGDEADVYDFNTLYAESAGSLLNTGDGGGLDSGDETAKKESRGGGGALLRYFDNPEVTTRHLDRKRIFELELFDLDAKFGNNFIGPDDILKKEIIIDIDELNGRIDDKGARLNLGLDFTSMRISVNPTQRWGGGVGLNVSSRFDLTMPKELFSLIAEGNQNHQKSSGEFIVSGSVFSEIEVNLHGTLPFLDHKLTIGVAPAYYSPLLYIPRSALNYTLDTSDKLLLSSGGRIRAYMPVDIGAIKTEDFLKSFGVDLSLSAEYALFRRLDLGLSVSHIPLVQARLDTGYEFVMSETEIIKIDDISNIDLNEVIKNPEITGGGDFISLPAINIRRPLRFDFYSIYRPFYGDVFSIRPNIGFTVLTASEEIYLNMGTRVTVDLARIFAIYFDTGLEEDLWRNKLGFEFNLRAFELDFEAALRSQSYLTSWTGSGLSVKLGIAFGW
jgi:hypothetical protein